MRWQANALIHERRHCRWGALMHISQKRRPQIIKCTLPLSSRHRLIALNCQTARDGGSKEIHLRCHEPAAALRRECAPPNITSPSQLRVTAETPTQTRQGDFGMPTSACDKRWNTGGSYLRPSFPSSSPFLSCRQLLIYLFLAGTCVE